MGANLTSTVGIVDVRSLKVSPVVAWGAVLQCPMLLESPELFGKIGTCRIERKEDYILEDLHGAAGLKGVEAVARPGRKAGVIAGYTIPNE